MRRHVTTCTLIAASALTLGFVSASPSSASPGPGRIPGTQPTWLAHAKRVGYAPSSAPVSARIYLAPRGGLDALATLANAVSTPGSPTYGKFLTPAQYHARFDPSQQTVSAVAHWLHGAGLRVVGEGANHSYLDVRGDVLSAQRAFNVRINSYVHNGLKVQAPDKALSAPAGLADSILTVNGVDTTPQTAQPLTQKPSPPSAGYRNAPVCGRWYGSATPTNTHTPDGVAMPLYQGHVLPFSPCGYTGPQLRNAYEAGAPKGLNGLGVTVAVVDAYASPTIVSDATTYATSTGDKGFAKHQLTQRLPKYFTQTSPTQCNASGWYGEETLDVEAVHAMAPGANVRYYAASSCNDQDLIAALQRINDEGVATVVSNSWGGAGDVVRTPLFKAYEKTFLQGATEGISFIFSSGDNGDEATALKTPQTDYPASDPYVTAVGGTSTEITPSGIKAETGWQTSKYVLSADKSSWVQSASFLYGGGGGYSSHIKEPSYQVNAGIVSPNGGRAVPDVSMDADPTTGMLIGQTQTFPDGVKYDTFRIGGTSLAAPLFAGMTAVKVEANGNDLGLLNPLIYSHHSGFADVTGAGMDAGNIRVDFVNGLDASGGYKYSVRTFNGATTSLKVGTGWDTETGWGTARAGWLSPVN